MAQIQIRGNTQIKALSIENGQLADNTIELGKLVQGSSIFLKDGSVAMAADLNVGTNQIVNLGEGVASTDAVNKGQLDGAISTVNSSLSTLDGEALKKANNLSDLDNAATARTNLDVYSKGETDALIAGLSGDLTYKGTLDFSAITDLPTNIVTGDFYKISGAGTVEGLTVSVGDMIIANGDVADPTSVDFDVIDNTEASDILRDGDVSSDSDLSVDGAKLGTRAAIKSAIDAAISSAEPNRIYGEEPVVTNGSASVNLAHTPVVLKGVYLNGLRTKYFTENSGTVTFSEPLETGDEVYADYIY